MKQKKTLAIIAAMVLVCVLSVAGTLAYLTASTSEVKNTFAASGLIDEGNFDLVEHQAVADDTNPGTYTLDTAKEVRANNYSSVVPGINVPKDPFVKVIKPKAKAYLFVEVDGSSMPDTLTWAVDGTNWIELTGVTPKVTGAKVYAYKSVIDAGDTKNVDILKDNQVIVAGNYSQGGTEESLNFYAYLTQAAGFETATAAWNATYGVSA